MHASLDNMQDAIDRMYEDKKVRLAQALNSTAPRGCPATHKSCNT